MEKNEEKQNTPDLDRIMMEGHPVFDGTETAEPAAEKKGPAEGAAEGSEIPAPSGEIPAAQPAAPAPAQPAPGEKPPEPPFRFKSHEESERGYRELQGKTTRAEQRAKELEAELGELRGAEERKKQQEVADNDFIEFASSRREQAMAEIDELDPDEPDYKKKVAQAWGRADKDILGSGPTSGPAQPPAATTPERKPGQAEPPAPGPEADADPNEQVRTYVAGIITQQGLEADDPLFWTFASRSPTETEAGEPMPMDEQIRWALDKTKDYHSRITGASRASVEELAAQAGRSAQLRDLPMGRSGGGPAPGESPQAEQPVSLDAALKGAERRL